MPRQWFVTPEVVRLDLPDDQWIDVKKTLNTGEVQAMYAAMRNERGDVDTAKISLAKVMAYCVGWSLQQHGAPVPLDEASLKNLHPDAFKEIREAIQSHEAKQEEAEEVKKPEAGETPSPAISASAA